MRAGRRHRLNLVAMATLVVAVALPLAVVLPRPAHSVSEYVFEARLKVLLGTSTNGQLTYWAASVLRGEAPADSVVLSFD